MKHWNSDKIETMNRETTDIQELALANILDIIPLISNTGEEMNAAIWRIYERNAEILVQY